MWACILAVAVILVCYMILDYQLRAFKLKEKERTEKVILLGSSATEHLTKALEDWRCEYVSCTKELMECIRILKENYEKTITAYASTRASSRYSEDSTPTTSSSATQSTAQSDSHTAQG